MLSRQERDVTGNALFSYAYPAPDAKREALLAAGSQYAVIARVDDYAAISIRGASAFIKA